MLSTTACMPACCARWSHVACLPGSQLQRHDEERGDDERPVPEAEAGVGRREAQREHLRAALGARRGRRRRPRASKPSLMASKPTSASRPSSPIRFSSRYKCVKLLLRGAALPPRARAALSAAAVLATWRADPCRGRWAVASGAMGADLRLVQSNKVAEKNARAKKGGSSDG